MTRAEVIRAAELEATCCATAAAKALKEKAINAVKRQPSCSRK